jgi:nucleoid-associated protein YgaU
VALSVLLLTAGCGGQKSAEQEKLSKAERAEKAVEAAQKAVDKTREVTDDWGLWKSVMGDLQSAKDSLEAKEYEKAIQTAEKVQEQADLGREQYKSQEQAWEQTISQAKESEDIRFPEQAWVAGGERAAAAAASGAAGAKQVETTEGTLKMGAADGDDLYEVARGDNLWDISSADSIYGDPFAWPLIYKANREDIHDPDLIYPGQQLTIERDVSSAERDRAVQHARTRGSWSLGEPEPSDLEYLDEAQ